MSFQDIDLQWFAAEDEGRTEEPSEYKLRKAREEGRIPKSQDLNSSVVFFCNGHSSDISCKINFYFLYGDYEDFFYALYGK